jgi:zeta toxin
LPWLYRSNAHEFQSAANHGVEKLFDSVRKNRQNAIIDGTLAHIGSTQKNIERCISKGDRVGIIYVYQDPSRAWEFTCKREALEQRKIEKETFIDAFLNAPKNVNELKARYGSKLRVYLLEKDFDNKTNKVHINVDKIESYLKISYNAKELRRLLP